MAIRNVDELKTEKIVIDLTGPDGNAFALMGRAETFAKQLKIDSEEIIREMMSGDYENLIKVFDKHFGYLVDLYR